MTEIPEGWRRPFFHPYDEAIGNRIMEMIPMPITLVITDADKQAACDLIGNDTYGKPVWTIETIPPENRVVQAFAKHRIASAYKPEEPRP